MCEWVLMSLFIRYIFWEKYLFSFEYLEASKIGSGRFCSGVDGVDVVFVFVVSCFWFFRVVVRDCRGG